MKKLIAAYRWFVYLIISILMIACGAESQDRMNDEPSSSVKESQPSAAAEEEMYEGTSTEKKDEFSVDVKKWKNKAKQQLESIQDLYMILKDSTLDSDFKDEIEKELNLLYSNSDSSLYDLSFQELDFKNFKDLKIENEDTMSLIFKNNKDLLKAKFIIEMETKQFGETIEVIEQLKLISIGKEN